MKIKVQCPCETRFEFEVEPVNGRMPVTIACPTCGANCTELANAVIQQQSVGAPVATAPSLRISKPHTAAAAPPAATPADEADVAETEVPASLCPRHKSETAVEVCCVCGKPICPKCMEQFGYVCSVYCRQQATQKRIYVPVYAHQKSVVAGKSEALVKMIAASVVVVVLLLLGFWTWYAWFARTPKIVYSLPIPKPDFGKTYKPDEYYQLIAPGQLLSVKNKKLSLFDLTQQTQVWSAALQSEAEAAAIKAARAKNEQIQRLTPKVSDENGFDVTHYAGLDPLGFEDDYYFADPRVVVTTNDIWVAFPNRLSRFDRQTGSPRETGIKDNIVSVTESEAAILVVSGTPGDHESLTEISLPGGTAETEVITAPPPKPATNSAPATANKKTGGKSAKSTAAVDKYPVGQVKTLAAKATPPAAPADDAETVMFDEERAPFIAAGPNVVQFTTKMLEHKTVAHVAMKAKGKSVLDSGNVTASQSLDLAQEMMNDSRREMTGGMEEEDVSRYQVTLHRRFEKDVPDWSGEVTGPPQFFPLKTVDVLTAGQNIYVFDKHNKKLWEAKLTFSVASRFFEDHAPCLETPDALYFADLGILTRYDLATGAVRWRYNSVGISRIQSDERGALYVDTTSAGPESIQYSQQVNIRDKIHPVLVKLSPDTGKVLWSVESVGDHVMLSGKFLYSTRVSTSQAALRLEEGPDTHFNLKLLDPSSGNEIWHFHRINQHIVKTEVQKNWILMHFEDEVVVLKFFSL